MKKLIWLGISLTFVLQVYSQRANWQNLDLQKDTIFGISTEKAYRELLKDKKSKTVIVAVIDGGIDTAHEDLKAVLWINPKEIPGNRKDDEADGYADDVHGWDFIGGAGGDVEYDNLELTRIIRRDKDFFDSLSFATVPPQYQRAYQDFRKMKKKFDQDLEGAQQMAEGTGRFKNILDSILQKLGNQNPSLDEIDKYQPADDNEAKVKATVLNQLQQNPDFGSFKKQVDDTYLQFSEQAGYGLNMHYDPRYIVGDNYQNSRERNYGNNDIYGPHASHGTHVAGIIAAVRNNGLGMDGIADNVAIIVVRVVPNGDERDKDVANGIRYAVDHGARVINMSFGKPYSWDKKIVDDAVKYAAAKDVLIVHAAGNDGKNLDNSDYNFFPNRHYEDSSGEAANWINVGASDWKDDSSLAASFSNYGKINVDVFAPGVQIYSTTPGSHYEKFNGTSMAAPVVSGLAALIREYYPKLTAVQVKEIIMKSVVKRDILQDKCVSGGVVNAYNALKHAAGYK